MKIRHIVEEALQNGGATIYLEDAYFSGAPKHLERALSFGPRFLCILEPPNLEFPPFLEEGA